MVSKLLTNINLDTDKNLYKQYLENSDTKAVTCLYVVSDIIGEDIIKQNLEKETIEIYLSNQGIKISPYNINKIMGSIVLMKDESVEKFANMFVLCVNAIINGLATTIPEDIANVYEVTKFFIETKFIYPDFTPSNEVPIYIEELLKYEGFIKPPKILEICSGLKFLVDHEKEFEEKNDFIGYDLLQTLREVQEEKTKAVEEEGKIWMSEVIEELTSLGFKKEDLLSVVERTKT